MRKLYLLALSCYFLTLIPTNAQEIQEIKSCAVNDETNISQEIRQIMKSSNSRKYARIGETQKLECLIAVTVDKSMFEYYDKDVEKCKNRVYELFSKASEVYERELNIKLTVSYIEIWDTRSYTTIDDFDDYWKNISTTKIPRHINHLLKMGYVEMGAAGIAFMGGKSSSTGFVNYTEVALKTLAHELGHNFGSPHTQNCEWPNGPIDFCAEIEGDCSDFGTKETRIGTIMSYCNNTISTFHPFCVNIMRSVAEKNLPSVKSIPNTPSITQQNLNLNNVTFTPYLNWEITNETDKYRIQLSENENFSTIMVDSVILYNQFQAFNLSNEKMYFWRVKAVNTKGESSWSSVAKFTTQRFDGMLSAPVLKYPSNFLKDLRIVNLAFYPVLGATEYEIQVADIASFRTFGFRDNNLIKTKTTTFQIDLFKDALTYVFFTNNFIWRVRAKNEQGYSAWSRMFHFDRDVNISRTFPNDKQTNIPLKTPISWVSTDGVLNKDYILDVSTKDDFSTIYHSEKFIYNELNSVGIVSTDGVANLNLQPNTTYYYRLKDGQNFNNVWVKKAFTTESNDNESKKWKFINQSNSILPSSKGILALHFQPNSNKVWIGATGLKSTDGVNWYENYSVANAKGVISNAIYRIESDTKGNVWILNENRIVKKTDNQFTVYQQSNSPLRTQLLGMAIDREDNIYTFCNENPYGVELFKFNGQNWSKLTSPFSERTTPTLLTDFDKNVWVYTRTGGRVAKLENNTWKYYELDMSKFQLVNQVCPDREGNLWVIGFSTVGKMTKEGAWSYYKMPIFPEQLVMTINKKNIPYFYLFSSNAQRTNKIYKFQDDTFIDLTPNPIPLDADLSVVKSIYFDNLDRLWIAASYGGLFIYDEQGLIKSQTITTGTVENKRITSGPFDLNATASSNLPIKLVVVSGPATISDKKVTLTGQPGKVIIRASQEGNATFEPAPNVEITFEVKVKDSQKITFATIPTKTLGDAPFVLAATASSNLPIVYNIVSGPATINGNILTLTGLGKVTLKATQAGNETYFAADDVTISFCVAPSKPTITSDISNPFLLKSSGGSNNQWYFNGAKIVGANGATYLSDKNGKYTVEVVNPEPTCPSATSTNFDLLVLSTEEENEWVREIKVFPNPIGASFSLTLPARIVFRKLTIYDLSGKKIMENTIPQEQYNTSGLPNGVFFIDIDTNQGHAIKKIVKH